MVHYNFGENLPKSHGVRLSYSLINSLNIYLNLAKYKKNAQKQDFKNSV